MDFASCCRRPGSQAAFAASISGRALARIAAVSRRTRPLSPGAVDFGVAWARRAGASASADVRAPSRKVVWNRMKSVMVSSQPERHVMHRLQVHEPPTFTLFSPMRSVILLACCAAFLPARAPAQAAKADSTDPYLWLEDVHGDRAMAWVQAE